MPTSRPELKFRRFLQPAMAAEWMMTWHEDRGISPGVPDLHYVIAPHNYRVGWLELKAIDKHLSGSRHNRIKVEPSQHQYIRRWGEFMPIHFLIRVVNSVYLVESKWHAAIPEITNAHDMQMLSVAFCDQADLAKVVAPALKLVTKI